MLGVRYLSDLEFIDFPKSTRQGGYLAVDYAPLYNALNRSLASVRHGTGAPDGSAGITTPDAVRGSIASLRHIIKRGGALVSALKRPLSKSRVS